MVQADKAAVYGAKFPARGNTTYVFSIDGEGATAHGGDFLETPGKLTEGEWPPKPLSDPPPPGAKKRAKKYPPPGADR
jgi:hypothetical protein